MSVVSERSKVGRVVPSAPWPVVKIGGTLNLINGRAFKPNEWTKTGTPIVRIQNLNNPNAPFNYYQGDLPAKIALADGDLLFAWSGTPGTSFGAHIWRGGKAWLNQHIFKVEFDANQFDKRFLQLAINQNLNEYIRAAHGGAGLAHITKGKFEASELPCPHLPEQRRIVAEIEKQFTRLDAGIAALRRTQANLKRYRAAVLKAACEGRLVSTEAELQKSEGRGQKSKTKFETGAELLARILTERRQNWQGRGQYKEPAAPEMENYSALPDGWSWASFDQVCEAVSDEGKKVAKGDYLSEGQFPVIDQGEAFVGGYSNDKSLLFSGALPVILFGDHTRRFKLASDRFIVGADGVKLIGLTGAWNPKFLLYQFQQLDLEDRGYSRHFQFVRKAPLRLPPLTEQSRIVAEVERRLSVVEESESAVTANLQRATYLRQSILQRAFTGYLAPQNPGDKPAETPIKSNNDIPEEAKPAEKKTISKDQNTVPSLTTTTLEELLQRLDSLGGAATPDRLLAASGLGEEVDKFFVLLREGRNNGSLIVPTGTSGDIKRNSREN